MPPKNPNNNKPNSSQKKPQSASTDRSQNKNNLKSVPTKTSKNDDDLKDEEENSYSEYSSRDSSRSESSSRHGSTGDEDEPEIDEGEDGYRPGGYHRVTVGDVMGDKWKVEKKLGWGHFSTVWLVRNGENGMPAALKVQKSAENYTEAAKDEIEILQTCLKVSDTIYSGKRFVVHLLDSFSHTGPNGDHMTMIFEVLGDNLLSLVEYYDYKGIPLYLVRQITWQICAGLDFLHRQAKVIHCDLKLENILISGLSANLAQQVAGGLPCVATLRLNNTTITRERDGLSNSSGGMVQDGRRKEETLNGKLIALKASLASLTGNDRKKAKRKIERFERQLEEMQKAAQPSGVQEGTEASKKSGANLIDTMLDDGSGREEDEGNAPGEWQVVSRSSKARSRSISGQVGRMEVKIDLASFSQLQDIANELFRRNLEFTHFPYEQDPKQQIDDVVTETTKADSNKEESFEKIGGVILSSDFVSKLVADGRACIMVDDEQGPVKLMLDLEGNKDKKVKCMLEELARDVDDAVLREVLDRGRRQELGLANTSPRKRRQNNKVEQQKSKTKLRPTKALYAVSCKGGDEKLTLLQAMEASLKLAFLFSPVPLVSFPESTILGVAYSSIVTSKDIRLRLLSERASSSLPPPLPPFIGSDLGILTPVDITVKIVDLGNACWTFNHFSDDIQTRQYRSPEVILESGYDCSADIWSMACVVFELLTGEFLFDPSSTKSYSRDDDHLALITELIGPIPKYLLKGRGWKRFYDNKGNLFRIDDELQPSSIERLLIKTYRMDPNAAGKIAAFLNPCLTWDPAKRMTAEGCLKHPFLAGSVG